MTNVERRIVAFLVKHKFSLFLAAVSLLGLLVRLSGLDMVSGDYVNWLAPWFDEIRESGGLAALDQQIGNYNIVYQIIIALLTYLPFDSLHLYKDVSIAFDYVLAIGVGMLAREMTGRGKSIFALAYSVVLFLPTCFLNSAFWAQCDSMYVSMLVFWFLYMLRKRYIPAFIFLGLAFSVKFQTIFVFPFLLCHYVDRREFSILHGLIPLAFAIVPNVLCGRHPLATFSIYLGQADYYKEIYMNFPSFWSITAQRFQFLGYVAMFLTVGLLGVGLYCLLHRGHFMDSRENQLHLLIWTAWTCLMFLPSMHDRYGYLVEILLIIAAMIDLKLFPIAMLAEFSAVITYSSFLWKSSAVLPEPLVWASALYIPAYVAFTYLLLRRGKNATGIAPTAV